MFEVARFDPAVEAVGGCRRWVRDCLRDQVDASVVQDAQLCVSELAANAVRHAASPFRVELRSDDARLRVSVHDESPDLPIRLDVDRASAGGRGLAIVDAVALRWGWTTELGDGKDVWFELATERHAAEPSSD